jgi:hypothetical protein
MSILDEPEKFTPNEHQSSAFGIHSFFILVVEKNGDWKREPAMWIGYEDDRDSFYWKCVERARETMSAYGRIEPEWMGFSQHGNGRSYKWHGNEPLYKHL